MIEVHGLSKSFAEPVLRDVSLTVPRGCLFGLVGPGAAGKSVLLKCLVGLVTPDRGAVTVAGETVTGLDELSLQRVRRRFGMLFQNNALFDYLTVGENIAFPLRRMGVALARGGNEEEARRKADTAAAHIRVRASS